MKLDVKSVSAGYGGKLVLDGVDLTVPEGGILTPRLCVYLKKQNTRSLVFNSVWNRAHVQHITSLQHAFVIPVARISRL